MVIQINFKFFYKLESILIFFILGDIMQCRMCGFEFDPMQGGSCGSCGQCKGCNKAICPRCGYGNSLSYEKEFDYISKLQRKLKSFKAKAKI